MKPALLLPLALASLGLAGLAIYAVQNREPVRPRTQARAEATPERGGADASPLARMVRISRGQPPTLAPPPPEADDEADKAAPPSLKEVPSRSEALRTFEALLGQLEEIDDPRELGARRREELYNGITGSFTVLSGQLGPDDRQLLEDSYARMMASFSRLKIERPAPEPVRDDEPYVAH